MATWEVLIRSGKSERQEQPSSERMFSVDEIAAILNVHPNTIRHWTDRGLLKAYRVGPHQSRRFTREDIHSFLEQWGNGMNSGNPCREDSVHSR